MMQGWGRRMRWGLGVWRLWDEYFQCAWFRFKYIGDVIVWWVI